MSMPAVVEGKVSSNPSDTSFPQGGSCSMDPFNLDIAFIHPSPKHRVSIPHRTIYLVCGLRPVRLFTKMSSDSCGMLILVSDPAPVTNGAHLFCECSCRSIKPIYSQFHVTELGFMKIPW